GQLQRAELVDVPGCYSLSARSAEEQIALNSVLGLDGYPKPDLVVVVVDAGQLSRNLYLALQLAEFRPPMLIALNMMDETEGAAPEPAAIAEAFGVPCIGLSARSGEGVEGLRAAISRALANPPLPRLHARYPSAVRERVDALASALPESWRKNVEHDRALALWALTSISDDDEL